MQHKTALTELMVRTFFLFLFSSSLQLLSQEGTPDMSTQAAVPYDEREEIFDPNGDYKLLENGKVKILGHHQNKVKTGLFIYYNRSGQVERKENYKDGLLHGESIVYNYGTLLSKREYYKGKKINYEYEFYGNDTTFTAGPYVTDEFKSGVFTMRSKTRMPMSNGAVNTRIIYDTIFLEARTPVTIHHSGFTKNSEKVSKDFLIAIQLKTKNASYAPWYLETIVSKMRSYNLDYFPSEENCLTKYYNASGKLIFKSDSGYTINYYPDGQLKDSISICKEGKVCRTGYNQKGELLYAVRMDKFSPQHTTNLYYDKNKALIYEVSAMENKPEKVKIYSDSIKKKNPTGILADCFETYYFYNPTTFAIDSSMTRVEYKYRKKTALPEGRYFMIAPKGKKKRMYRIIEIHGNYYNDYGVDSTLVPPPGKGARLDIYQNDSVSFLVQQNSYDSFNTKEEKYLIRKLLLKNDKLYMVHNQVHRVGVYDKGSMLLALEADTLPNLKTELIPERDFRNVLAMKSISTLSKKECLQWLKTCEAIDALNEKNKAAFAGNNAYFYTIDILKRVFLYEFYKMGYNPYVREEEYVDRMQFLKLSPAEYEQAMKYLQ